MRKTLAEKHAPGTGLPRCLLCGTILLLFIMVLGFSNQDGLPVPSTPSPPAQPDDGPGGRNYRHDSVIMNTYEEGEEQYWIFEPASPAPLSAPVIIFNHGWLGKSPESYGAWIEHLVRRGNIVVYPAYERWFTPPQEMTANAIASIREALECLKTNGHVSPDLERFAIIGHSLGGAITINLAAIAVSAGLPEPRALMLALPGDAGNMVGNIVVDMNRIPSSVLMLCVVCSQDIVVGSTFARRIMGETLQVSEENKNLISVYPDSWGSPPLVADHFAPISPDARYGVGYTDFAHEKLSRSIYRLFQAGTDALDYYAFWKLFDGLTDAAFYGENREYALGDTKEQRFMGYWSDGKPVKELGVTGSFGP